MIEALLIGEEEDNKGADITAYEAWCDTQMAVDLSSSSTSLAAGKHRSALSSSTTPVLTGTPWGNIFGLSSNVQGLSYHSLPSESVIEMVIKDGSSLLFTVTANNGSGRVDGVLRNGLQSSVEVGYGRRRCTEMLYYDSTTGKIMKMAPFTKVGPTENPTQLPTQ